MAQSLSFDKKLLKKEPAYGKMLVIIQVVNLKNIYWGFIEHSGGTSFLLAQGKHRNISISVLPDSQKRGKQEKTDESRVAVSNVIE